MGARASGVNLNLGARTRFVHSINPLAPSPVEGRALRRETGAFQRRGRVPL